MINLFLLLIIIYLFNNATSTELLLSEQPVINIPDSQKRQEISNEKTLAELLKMPYDPTVVTIKADQILDSKRNLRNRLGVATPEPKLAAPSTFRCGLYKPIKDEFRAYVLKHLFKFFKK